METTQQGKEESGGEGLKDQGKVSGGDLKDRGKGTSRERRGPAGRAGKGEGRGRMFAIALLLTAAAIGGIMYGAGELMRPSAPDLAHVKGKMSSSYVENVKEYQHYGLSQLDRRDDLWKAMRKNPPGRIELCSAGTTFFIHSLYDVVSVNGYTVSPATAREVLSGPYAFQQAQTLMLPAGTTAVTITGIRANTPGGKIVFVLDTLPEGNRCGLKETHQGVGLLQGESITIPGKIF